MLSEKEGLTPLYNLDDWSCQVYGKTGYRLPTEAEWEYAAQFDDNRKYPWGNQEPDKTLVNGLNYYYGIKPVGTCSPKGDSKLGISDLAGNAAEWLNDWYSESYAGSSAVTDPVGPGPAFKNYLAVFKTSSSMRVMRGGACLYDPEFRKGMGEPFVLDYMIHPDAITTTFRSYTYPDISDFVKGFRVVKTVATAKTKPAFSAADKDKPVYGGSWESEDYSKVSSYDDQFTNSLGNYAVTVYFPSHTVKEHFKTGYPAVIFAPGGKLTKEAYRWIGGRLAHDGYIVLIFSVPTKDEFGTKERVEGFKSAISYLIAKNKEPGQVLKGEVNTGKIAVGGHSLGGRSVYEFISGNPKTIAAAFILSSQCESPEMAKKISIPVQIQIGDADTFVKPENALSSYNDLGSGTKEFLQIAGADHLQFITMRGKPGAGVPNDRGPAVTATISREDQQKISSKYFIAWLDYYLKGDTKNSDTIFGNGVKNDLKSGVLSDFKTNKK
jgi:dienelactone hydrolase